MHANPTPTPDGDPYVTVTALCEAGRHAACRGGIISLLAEPGTRCGCGCHRQQLHTTWADQVAALPPCTQDGGEAA